MGCPFFDKVVLFYQTLVDVVSHFIKTGKVIDRAALSQTRMESCKNCSHRTQCNTCEICGCFLHIKTKFIAACCPLGKW
jgi:hypothetical protein